MIKLENVNKVYKVGEIAQNALENINLEFNKTGFTSIIGDSGSGKSTLLNIIGGLDKITSGSLFIDGKNAEAFKNIDWDNYRNKKIGFIFQNFALIEHLTVLENVELALLLDKTKAKERKEKAEKALKQVNLEHLKNKNIRYLSGGEMQRVAIARALVNNPDIILADEPTGSLDSNNSLIIIKILKELSINKLVIMVTHNEELANSYSNRIIELKDGKVIKDFIIEEKEIEKEIEKNNKINKKYVSMSFINSLFLSFKNLKNKWHRTILTLLAGAIGIVAVTLVISVKNGLDFYIEEVQRTSLSKAPITVYSSLKSDTTIQVHEGLTEYPEDSNEAHVIYGSSVYDHLNNMDEDFVNYLEEMDNSLYSVIDYNTSIQMNLLYKNNENTIRRISSSYFVEMTDDEEFINSQYQVLSGKIPESYNEIALVLDSYNCIRASFLSSIGLEYENIKSYTFQDLLNLKYQVIDNNDLYIKQNDVYMTKGSSFYNEMYDNSKLEIKIVGILRAEKGVSNELYSSSNILYTKELTEKIKNNALESNIVKEQIECGVEKNVFTNTPFLDYQTTSGFVKKEYQYESQLSSLGAVLNLRYIYVYSESFNDRILISNYINDYENELSNVKIICSDSLKNITEEFAAFVKVLSKVLIILASISLLVSAIMITIISYISVIERIKEIGILRSVGARRIDIRRIFISENILIGLGAGILGIIGSFILASPINRLVKNIISEYVYFSLNIEEISIIDYNYLHLIIIVIFSMVLSIISGLIPSIIASYKNPIEALRSE